MKIKNSVVKTIFIAFIFLIWIIAVIIIFKYPNLKLLYRLINISFFLGISGFFIGWFIKKYTFKELLKTLLPTSATILGTIWLLSTGYLNIKAENLKKDISVFERDTLELKMNLRELQNSKDSILSLNKAMIKEKDSLIDTNLILRMNSQKNSTELERDNAQLKFEINKLKPLLRNSDKPIIILKSIDLTDIKREIKITFYDKYGNILNAKDITLMPERGLVARYIENEKYFFINFTPPPEEFNPGLNYKAEILKKTKNIFIYNSDIKIKDGRFYEALSETRFKKSIVLPFATGTYDVIFNDF